MTPAPEPDLTDLLAGLEGRAREEREELVRWLLAEGYAEAEIAGAITPMLLPAGRAMGDVGERLTADDVAARSGLDRAQLRDLLRAAGLAGIEDEAAAVYTTADVAAVASARGFLDAGVPYDNVIAVTRVLSHGLAQAAEVMRESVLAAVLHAGASELDLARSYALVVEQVAPLLAPTLDGIMRQQLLHTLETEAISVTERAAGSLPGARDVAVAFADVVGFTRMGEALAPEDLEGVARTLADHARDVAVHPVRFVKTIGDAVMLVSPDAQALVAAMLRLAAAAETGPDVPPLRIGVAFGPAVSRAGDWFGAPVNLASRVTAVARPGSVLVAEDVRAAVGEDTSITWSYAGERRVKGVRDEIKLFRARASAPNGR